MSATIFLMPKPRWLTAEQERAWRRYRRMRTLLDLELSRDLRRDSGLSDADYDVLTMLSDRPEHALRSRELGSRLKWSTSRLSHQVGRMEQRGLVARSATDDDARGAMVALTDDGWQALLAAAPLHVESVRRNLIDLISPAELRTLDRIAGKVLDHLQPGAADAD
jgi:DNA-binding MarR family transcriptional regulator